MKKSNNAALAKPRKATGNSKVVNKTKGDVTKLPKLPKLLETKLYKTGQTRGADDDVIFQNRVMRNSTVLIPYRHWAETYRTLASKIRFENGFIVLLTPEEYFNEPDITKVLADADLELGRNALVFFETRDQLNSHSPEAQGWRAASKRIAPLGGKYAARVPATTSISNGNKIVRGYINTSLKGAGIRVYEYASKKAIDQCREQLEALFWLCRDANTVALGNGMSAADISTRIKATLESCTTQGLLDFGILIKARLVNEAHFTICPLCLKELSANGLLARMSQAEGREVPDLTVTEINLFHVEELRFGAFNHRPYNLGWGHHHCNVVTKDSGIDNTLKWMQEVLNRNNMRS